MPRTSWARGAPLRPIPNSKRPSLKWSTVAMSSAIRSGWFSGRTCTAVPTRIRLGRAGDAAVIRAPPGGDPPGGGGGGPGQRDRRGEHGAGRVEVDLAEPHAVEPQ